MLNAYKKYSQESTDFSIENFKLKRCDATSLAAISYGVLEELGEVIEVVNSLIGEVEVHELKEDLTKEIGDTICYLSIMTNLLEFHNLELDLMLCIYHQHLEIFDDMRYGILNARELMAWVQTAEKLIRNLLGQHKRLFRGDHDRNALIDGYNQLYSLLALLLPLVNKHFRDIFKANSAKLSARKKKNSLLGSGSRR